MSTANGHYLIEVDGVAVCEASEIETGGAKHEPFKIFLGNRATPILGRGKTEFEEVKIKQAHGLNNEFAEFSRMFTDYIYGRDLTKPTIRVVTLDEDGKTVVCTDEYIDCVPTMFQPEGKKGDSKDGSYFSIGFKPSDMLSY